MPQEDRYQFGVRRLLVLTTAVAFVLAIVLQFGGTTYDQGLQAVVQGTLAVYLLTVISWAILRGPTSIVNGRESAVACSNFGRSDKT